MKPVLAMLWSAGLVLLIGLVAWLGVGEVAASVAAAGWWLLLITAWHLLPLVGEAIGWWLLIPRTPERPGLALIIRLRWYSEAVNTLLPVPQVGGDVLRGVLLARTRLSGALAAATVVVDLTATVITQILFSLLGLVALLLADGGDSGIADVAVGIAAFAVAVAGFLAAQRSGLLLRLATRLERVAGDAWLAAADRAARLDRSVRRLYRRRGPFWGCCGWHLAGWLLGIGEVWLALHALGLPASFADALILESLIMAVRTAAFFVPGAIGVQEGSLVLLGALVGLDPESALALSLIKRVRELAIGLPALVAWRIGEGWRRLRPNPTVPAP